MSLLVVMERLSEMNTSYIESHTLLAGSMMESFSNITHQIITDNTTLTALSSTLGKFNSSNLITLSLCQAVVRFQSQMRSFACHLVVLQVMSVSNIVARRDTEDPFSKMN